VRGAGVIEIGWSAERVFRCSIQYCVYGVVFLMCGTLDHFRCIGRLVFVAVHYPRACNKQVGLCIIQVGYCTLAGLRWSIHRKRCTLCGLKGAWHRAVTATIRYSSTLIAITLAFKTLLFTDTDITARARRAN